MRARSEPPGTDGRMVLDSAVSVGSRLGCHSMDWAARRRQFVSSSPACDSREFSRPMRSVIRSHVVPRAMSSLSFSMNLASFSLHVSSAPTS